MRNSRYGRGGWFGESHRHYLASKGVSTRRYLVKRSDLYPVRESDSEQYRRFRDGFDRVILVDARKFKSGFESGQGQSLAWNNHRLDNLRDVEFVDSFPRVTENIHGVDVVDGRHRIALASERGLKIPVSTREDKEDSIRRYTAPKQWHRNLEYTRAGVKDATEVTVLPDEVFELKLAVEREGLIMIPVVDKNPAYISVGESKTFVVARPDHEAEAIEASELLSNAGDLVTRDSAGYHHRLGELFGYPEGAVSQWIGRTSKGSRTSKGKRPMPLHELDAEAVEKTVALVGTGKVRALKAGVSQEDVDLLEFMPSDDVSETKQAISVRKAALAKFVKSDEVDE